MTLVLLFSLQSYWVQTFFGNQLTKYYANVLNTEFSVESIKLNGLEFMQFNNVLIRDLRSDTLAFLPSVLVDINDIDFNAKKASIKSIVFNEPFLNLNIQKGEDKLNLDFIINYFSNSEQTEEPFFNVGIESISFLNTQFDYNDYNHQLDSTSFDVNHIGLSQFNFTLNNFNSESEDVLLNISNLSLLDKCGFKVNKLATNLTYSSNEIRLDSTIISTPYSTLSSRLMLVNYNDISDFNNFFNNVSLKSTIDSSNIGLNDLAFFDTNLGGVNEHIKIKGKLSGKLSELKIDDLFLGFSENSFFNSDVFVDGLPELDSTIFELNIKGGHTSKKEIDKIDFKSFGLSSDVELPIILDGLGSIDLYGDLKGSYSDFESHFHIASEEGSFDGLFRANKKEDEYNYDGNIDVSNLNLRTLIRDDDFNTLNAKFKLKGKGFSLDDVDVAIDGELLDFVYKGYPYEDIIIKGDLKEKAFVGSLDLIDGNVNLSFDGNFDLTHSPILFDFEIDLMKANLSQLKLIENRKDASVGFNLYASGFGSNLDDFSGMIDISNINYNENGIDYYFDSILFDSQSNDYFHSMSFHSKMAEFELSGQYHINTMLKDIYCLGSSIFPSILPPDNSIELSRENFVMNAKINDMSKLSSLFFPDLDVSPHATILCEYNSISQMLDVKAHSDWLIYNGLELTNLSIDTTKKIISNSDTSYVVQVSIDNVVYDNSIDIQNLKLESKAFRDNFEVDVDWLSADSSLWGFFSSHGMLLGDGDFDLFVHPSRFSSSKTGDWYINDTTLVQLAQDDIQINDFSINNSDQKIYVDGFLSKDPEKELKIDIQEISLNNINSLFALNDFELNGSFNLTSTLKDIYNEIVFSSKALIYGIKLDEYLIGDMSLSTTWDSDSSRINMSGGLMSEIHDEEIIIEEEEMNIVQWGWTKNWTSEKKLIELLEKRIKGEKIELPEGY